MFGSKKDQTGAIDDNTIYECTVCGHLYEPAIGDPERGIPPHTPFSKLPDDWVCPVCGSGKNMFKPRV
ncbi:MAG: rubredoxin [Syntrophomonas sp.]